MKVLATMYDVRSLLQQMIYDAAARRLRTCCSRGLIAVDQGQDRAGGSESGDGAIHIRSADRFADKSEIYKGLADAAGSLLRIRPKRLVGSLNVKTGHLTRIIDKLNNNRNREYEFDALGRLTKAKGGPFRPCLRRFDTARRMRG